MMVCSLCGTRNEGYVLEEREFEVGTQGGRFAQRSSVDSQARLSRRRAAERAAEHRVEVFAEDGYMHCLQRVVQRQARSLIEAGVAPGDFESLVREIWRRLLLSRRPLLPHEGLFRTAASTGMRAPDPPALDEDVPVAADAAVTRVSLDDGLDWEEELQWLADANPSQPTERPEVEHIDADRAAKELYDGSSVSVTGNVPSVFEHLGLPRLAAALVVTYVGLLLVRAPVSAADLLGMVEVGALPYWAAWKALGVTQYLPRPLVQLTRMPARYLPSWRTLDVEAALLAQRLDISLPPVNAAGLARAMAARAGFSDAVAADAVRLLTCTAAADPALLALRANVRKDYPQKTPFTNVLGAVLLAAHRVGGPLPTSPLRAPGDPADLQRLEEPDVHEWLARTRELADQRIRPGVARASSAIMVEVLRLTSSALHSTAASSEPSQVEHDAASPLDVSALPFLVIARHRISISAGVSVISVQCGLEAILEALIQPEEDSMQSLDTSESSSHDT